MKKYIFLLIISLSISCQAQIFWQRPISSFSRHDYHAGIQNWMTAENKDGWIYVANNSGMLEFDGVFWNTYTTDHDTKARALMADGDDIYIGGLGEFGRFRRNAFGLLDYTSLSDGIGTKSSLNIWGIYKLGTAVCFQADNSVYIYKDKCREIRTPHSITCSGMVGDKLYVATTGGLYLLNGSTFVRLSAEKPLRGLRIVSITSYREKLLAVSENGTAFLLNGNTFETLNTGVSASVSCAAVLGDQLALGTLQDGLYIVNLRTGTKEVLTMASGLHNNSIRSLKFDSSQHLWVGYDNGIECISMSSSLFFLNSSLHSIGSGYAACIYQDRLYLGTNQGVYSTNLPTTDNRNGEMHTVKDAVGLVHCMKVVDGTLFCGGRNFFIQMDGDRTTNHKLRGVWNIIQPRHNKDILLLGTYWGLYIMRKHNGNWLAPIKVKDNGISARRMFLEEGTNAVWVANKAKGIFRLTMSQNFSKAMKQTNYNSDELPTGKDVYMANIDGNLVIATKQGLFKYNVTADKIERDTRLEDMLNGRQSYSYIYQDSERNIWYATQSTLHLLRYDKRSGKYLTQEKEAWLNDNIMEDYETVCIYKDNAVISTEDGFAFLSLTRQRQHPKPHLQIHKMYITNGADSLVYAYGKDLKEHPIRIDYGNNSVRLEYSATNYDRTNTVLYSYKLEGHTDNEWSRYSPAHIKEYTHLPEGTYKFCIRMIDNNSKKPMETSIEFTILPPWYRSWWAYIIYLLIIVGGIYYICNEVHEEKKRLIRQNEEKLARQEEKFKKEDEEKGKVIENLKEQNLELELRSKNNELVLSHLNVVRKNEMLEDIKKSVQSVYNNISEENIPNMRRKMSKLLQQISTNMEQDNVMQSFQTSFDEVHHDFLKVLDERFPNLSHKEKMLCVYIRMNMLTKEIAPLLNLSVRGVEIGRYRLRKKLSLDARENLTLFLQKLAPAK